VAVVGGGAAGLMAAISASHKGAKVVVLERLDRVGKKILATGNGRCNISNTDLSIDHYHGTYPKFAYSALRRFDFNRTMDFFERLGVTCKVEDGGRVYPASDQSSSVLDVLRYEIDALGVETFCSAGVKDISGGKDSFALSLGEESVKARRVIIATGGRSAPNLGSNGSGYPLAEKYGHIIVEPFPALVQLRLGAEFLKQISGIKFFGEAELLAGGKSLGRAAGEILFTDYGISGPPVFCLSRAAGECLRKGEKTVLKICLINNKTKEELDVYLFNRLRQQSRKTLAFSFVGFVNKRLAPVLLREAGVADVNKSAGQVTAEERKKILHILQDWRFEVTGTNPWQSAQVTAGGVDVRDINQKTMESRLVPGLFFAGEIIDIDGDCGGYNLQWAWSSGFVAGEHAAIL
jgi:predicted Rossmann fold flavoprotein